MESSENRRQSVTPVTPRFDVVAIGASAGGVEALRTVTAALPADFPVPILIVQHMDPRRKSMLAALLDRHCRLHVTEAGRGERIAPGTVYIAPPNMHLLVRDGHLELSGAKAVHFTRPSIDLLFESVAAAYGDRAIGVILSGSGVDGAAGIRAIKLKAGTTVIQDPATAAHTGMPQAARATGCVDATLTLEDIGPTLIKLVTSGSGDAA